MFVIINLKYSQTKRMYLKINFFKEKKNVAQCFKLVKYTQKKINFFILV